MADERLEALLLEGQRSGRPRPIDQAWWRAKRARIDATSKSAADE